MAPRIALRNPDVERSATAGVFILFVAVGAAFIIFAKSQHYSAVLVTLLPIAIMVAYAILVWLGRFLGLRDDQVGDNVYYMGFLFTLTSLGVSLYEFSSEGSSEQIVGNFGIAIGSTIAGVALRVFFNQMRRDPIEVEAAARLELAEAARRVRTELDNTVLEMNQFMRTAQQSVRDSYLEMETTLGALSKRLAEDGSAVATSSKEFSKSLGSVTKKLDAITTPERLIDVRIEPMAKAFVEELDRVRKETALNTSELQRAVRAIEEISRSISQRESRAVLRAKRRFGWWRGRGASDTSGRTESAVSR